MFRLHLNALFDCTVTWHGTVCVNIPECVTAVSAEGLPMSSSC